MIDVISLDQSDSYNLRLESLTRRNNFSFQTVSTIGSILWKKTIKQPTNAASLNIFKEKMKTMHKIYKNFGCLSIKKSTIKIE